MQRLPDCLAIALQGTRAEDATIPGLSALRAIEEVIAGARFEPMTAGGTRARPFARNKSLDAGLDRTRNGVVSEFNEWAAHSFTSGAGLIPPATSAIIIAKLAMSAHSAMTSDDE